VDVDVQPEQLVEAACAVEAAGFHAVWVSDHPLPYDLSMLTSSGVSEGSLRYDMRNAGHQAWDPFTVLGWLAAATDQLKLHMNAVVMPYRNPFVTAKAAATLPHLSGGRLIMGLAPGYLRAEFEALGADISARAEFVQEGLHAMRTAWAGKPFQLRSSRWHVDGNSALPAPIRNRWCGPRETRVRPSRWPRDHVTAGLHSRSRVSAPRRPNGSGESGREAHKAPRALSHAAARSCPTRPVGRVNRRRTGPR
jgi:alkanesulfonate monooxygenase SsuD/methylene tetrahydromethanopterin reductase-like flavin-dependent oxidoreductase (luciferase family)